MADNRRQGTLETTSFDLVMMYSVWMHQWGQYPSMELLLGHQGLRVMPFALHCAGLDRFLRVHNRDTKKLLVKAS